MQTLVLIGFVCAFVLFLIALYGFLRFLEWMFPALSRWLDSKMPDQDIWR